MKVLISGGSGLIGKRLSEVLLAAGHDVAWLGRKAPESIPAGIRFFSWNPEKLEMAEEAVDWAEAVINLAGASIGENPWNVNGRKLILESRLKTVQTLTKHFSGRGPLKAFTGISGAGYYGPGHHAFLEDEPAGKDFPAMVAAEWEKEYLLFQERCKPEHFCILRLAVVLSKTGGALEKMVMPFRFGAGAVLGNGKQPFNWIHLEDAVQIIACSLEWNGIFNASAPAADDNRELSRQLARVLGRPLLLPPVPGFMLKMALGERSSLVLQGNHSHVQKVIDKGYRFRFPDLNSALTDLL